MFETSDTEVVIDDKVPSEVSRRSSIDVLETTAENARVVFENRIIDKVGANFSSKITNLLAKTYNSYTVPETPEQKLTRIKRELEELRILKDTKVIQDDKNEIQLLIEQVKKLLPGPRVSLSNNVDSFLVSKLDKLSPGISDLDEELKNKSHAGVMESAPVVDLEQRISRLEKTVGHSEPLEQNTNFSVQSLIDDLYRKLNIISNSEGLKPTGLLVDSDSRQLGTKKLELRSESILDETYSDKREISILFDKLSRLPDFERLIPLAMNKIKSLNTLNSELSKNVDNLEDFESRMFSIETSMNEWQDFLSNYENKLSEMEAKSEANKNEIRKWVDSLESKLNS